MLETSYIIPRLQGRTGNMMFQIAHAYAKSLEYNRPFTVCLEGSLGKHLEKTLFRKVNTDLQVLPAPEESKYINSPFHYVELEHPSNEVPTVYAGWYQSEKYFLKYKEIIKDLFSPTLEFINKAFIDYPFLGKSTVGAINIRRGDYLTQPTRHPVVSIDYINEAYKQLPKCDYILVISDDIEWCKQNINLPNLIFVETYIDCDALWLLSLCDHFIISNSSFSWWGAYLSNNKDKTVIAPGIWVGPDIVDNMEDIWCEDWIKIKTNYKEGIIILDK